MTAASHRPDALADDRPSGLAASLIALFHAACGTAQHNLKRSIAIPAGDAGARKDRPYLGRGMTSEVFPYGPGHVIKLFYPHVASETIQQEVTATTWAHARGLPVAQPLALTSKGERTGIVLAHLDGPTLIKDGARSPLRMLLGLRRLARLQARINRQDATGLPSLHDLLRFQVGHARVSETARRATAAALERLPQGSRLCHGDLHPSNVICTRHGLHVIDWQKASSGNPAADVARTLLLIRYGRLKFPSGIRSAVVQLARLVAAAWYVRCYARASGISPAEVDAWMLLVLVTKLTGPVAGNEAEVHALVERLVARQRSRSSTTAVFGESVICACALAPASIAHQSEQTGQRRRLRCQHPIPGRSFTI